MTPLPPNLMGLTVQLTVAAGSVSKTYATIASVQTHKLSEMTNVLEAMWRVTLSAADSDELRAVKEDVTGEQKPEAGSG